jgi:uncharacterized protein
MPALDAPDRTRRRLYLNTRQRDGPHRLSPSAPEVPSAVARRSFRSISPIAATSACRGRTRCAASNCQCATASASSAIRCRRTPRSTAACAASSTSHPRARQDVDWSVSLYEQTASGEYQLLFEPYDFRASYAGHRVKRRLLRAGERQLLAFTAELMTASKLAAGSRLVLVIGLNKRPDRQINYGSGKDVNSETIADAARPVRVRWHARSHVEIQTSMP